MSQSDVVQTVYLEVATDAAISSPLLEPIEKTGETPGSAYIEGPLHVGNSNAYTRNDANERTEFGTISISETTNEFQTPEKPKYSLFVKTYARIKSFLKVDKLLTVELIKAKIIYTETLMARSKNFIIDHPNKENKKLVHACLEGPENGVYIRGRLSANDKIFLPEYWTNLIDYDTITVSLTPIGSHQDLIVKEITQEYITIQSNYSMSIDCFYHIFAERKDIHKLETEIDA